MKTTKKPTALQLFKQWKKTNLAENKARKEQQILREMAWEARNENVQRLTVDGYIYELYATGYGGVYNAVLKVTNLGSVEEFANLIQ
jgi:hypothetical protein